MSSLLAVAGMLLAMVGSMQGDTIPGTAQARGRQAVRMAEWAVVKRTTIALIKGQIARRDGSAFESWLGTID